jgi:hypothetical protein
MANVTHPQTKKSLVRIAAGLFYNKMENKFFIENKIGIFSHQGATGYPGMIGIAAAGNQRERTLLPAIHIDKRTGTDPFQDRTLPPHLSKAIPETAAGKLFHPDQGR